MPLHYGQAAPFIRCAFGKIPLQPLREFVHWAREALPNEVAGGLAYSIGDGALRLVRFASRSQSPHHVAYRIPPLRPDEVMAVDLHSHGHDAAFFSATDDADDTGIKIAGVFGHLDRAEPSSRFRLVAGQVKLDLPGPQNLFLPAGGS
jgi:PRTRC genetic system protein A